MNEDRTNTIDFIGIGAAKSASSWLSKCLQEHPDILFASEKSRKEISFFNSHSGWQGEGGYDLSTWEKGLNWYLEQFPPYQPRKIRGEFTVSYLIDKKAYKRIFDTFPNIKVLAILRNPIDMIYSMHNYMASSAVVENNQSFEEMVENETLLDFGNYYKHLKKFYDLFPKENIYVVILDYFKKNGVEEIQRVYRFLGVEDSFIPPSIDNKVNESFQPRFEFVRKILHKILRRLHKINKGLYYKILDCDKLANLYSKVNKKKGTYDGISADMRKKLYQYYKNDINKLESLLDKDLSMWKES